MFDHFAFSWEYCASKGKVFSIVSEMYLDTYIKALAETLFHFYQTIYIFRERKA